MGINATAEINATAVHAIFVFAVADDVIVESERKRSSLAARTVDNQDNIGFAPFVHG